MIPTRLALTATWIWVVIVAAGCGGGGAENDYAEKYTAVTKRIAQRLGTLQSATSTDPTRFGPQLRALAAELGKAGDELAAIEPPDDADAGHARVQAGVRTLAADVRQSAEAIADASSPSVTADALTALPSSKGAAQIAAGEQALRRAGYELE